MKIMTKSKEIKEHIIKKFEGFPIEGIMEFYDHILSYNPIKNYYLEYIWIHKTFRGKPKRWTNRKIFYGSLGYQTEKIPYTGAGAAGYDCIVEKVYFNLLYFNINHKKSIQKRGLYLRGICSEDNRSGGTHTIFKRLKI